MTDSQPSPADTPPDHPTTTPRRRWGRVLWHLLWLLLGLLLTAVAVLYYWAGTNAGSQRMLSWIANQQQLIHYRYVGGNLRDGLQLDHITVKTKHIDVMVQHAVLKVGWRSVLQREVHFRQAELTGLAVIKKTPPSGKPFDFKTIKLPFTLRFDDAVVHDLQLRVSKNPIIFSEVVLHDALWAGDHLSLKQSSLKHSAVAVDHITGDIRFSGLYPIHATGQLVVPALSRLGLSAIDLKATGTLDTLNGTLKVAWPDAAVANVVVHPVRDHVPYAGTLTWQGFAWPFAKALRLQSTQGQADVQGTVQGLSATIHTDLSSRYTPKGQFFAQASTDFKGLEIQQLTGHVLKGSVTVNGRVDWAGGVRWRLLGQSDQLQLRPLAPQAIAGYVPQALTGQLTSIGALGATRSVVGAVIRQDNGESLVAGVAQLGHLGQAGVPLWVDARWKNLRRTVAGVGAIDSQRGRAVVQVHNGTTGVDVHTTLKATSSLVPAGTYQAKLGVAGSALQIPLLRYEGVAGALAGSAQVTLAQAKQPLRWQASVQTTGLDAHRLVASVPFKQITGRITASGQSTAAQQTIRINPVALKALLVRDEKTAPRPVELIGKGNVVLLMNQGKTHGLKSFGVQFDGALNTPDVPKGSLIVKAAGTPQLIRVAQLTHRGAAGAIDAKGEVQLDHGAAWQVSAQMQHFDPSFFVAGWKGDLTGHVDSQGRWQTSGREIKLRQLDVVGTLRDQPIQASGQLDVVLGVPRVGEKPSWIPQRFLAQQLRLAWAGNRMVADGNAQQLNATIDAPALGLIHPNLQGRVTGTATVTGAINTPDVNLMLDVDQLRFGELKVQHATLRGNVPAWGRQPSQLTLHADQLSQGNRQLSALDLQWSGTQSAHVLKASTTTGKTTLSFDVAGGLRNGYDWYGQLRDGQINTKLISLRQQTPAALVWLQASREVTLGQHCWQAADASHLCLTDVLSANPQRGMLAVRLEQLDLLTFRDLMPEGFVWTGKLNGQAKAGWQKGNEPSLDAQIYTEKGTLGLTAEDPQDPPMTLPYDRLSLSAVTQPDGVKIRFDAKTPDIGTGYIDAIIDPKSSPKTINGALVLDNVQVNVFQPFFAGLRTLSGVASLAGGMSGPLTGPQFYGEFRLKDGRVAMANLPVNLNNIQLHSSIRGTQASMDGSFFSGDGRGTLDGKAVWLNEPRVNLTLAGDNLLIRKAPLLTARVTPNIDVSIWPSRKQVAVDGKIFVPSAVVTPAPTDDDAMMVSSDVRVIDRRVQTEDPVLKAVKPWRIDADIDLSFGNAVFFRGFGANAPLGGQLHLKQRGLDGLTASGQVAVQRSVQVEAFGQNLMLRRGIARFGGSLTQPILDIEATKSVSGRTVGVRVGGKLSRPGIVIFNDAGLTEQEALNALLTGRISANNTVTNTAGFKSEVNNTVAAAGLSLGLSGSRNFTNKLGRTFGLSGLTVDAEGVGDDTQVNVTGYLSPDLYLRYGVGVFTPVNKLTLRYQINRRLYIEASSALEKAIDVFYNWRF